VRKAVQKRLSLTPKPSSKLDAAASASAAAHSDQRAPSAEFTIEE
jgi:hypothetical protein